MVGAGPRFESKVVVALTSAFAACSSDHDAAARLPDDVLTPVDCSNLCPAPKRLVDDAMHSDAVRLAGAVDAGEAQVLLEWSDGASAAQWFLPAPTSEASISPGADDLPLWNVRIEIPCFPESVVNAQWKAEASLTPGTYPLVFVSFDVPEREQGADLDSLLVSGEVVITSATDDLVSGYLQGWGGGDVESYATQEQLGLRYEVAAMRFDQIGGDLVR
jgi:hypothetical protein